MAPARASWGRTERAPWTAPSTITSPASPRNAESSCAQNTRSSSLTPWMGPPRARKVGPR
eukprot:1091525-Pyramimonas_sp.AAC.1